MANITELLEALNTRGAAVPTADLASGLKASREGTLKQLNREKDKGTVEGNSQEGWLITDAGRRALGKGDIHPSMIDEEVTMRQQFEAIGRRIGIKDDRIVLATDIVWSGDYNDVSWVWRALGQADIADDLRSVWVNAWRAKLHKGVPPELETELTGVSKTVAAEEGKDTSKGRDYIIIDDEPLRVGENLGDYNLQDAKDILTIRTLKGRLAGAQAGGGHGAGSPAEHEKVSDLITALAPLLKKDSDVDTLKEILADKLEIQRQDILSRIPQQEPSAQPKSFIEQITGFVAALGSLKEAGPLLRSILGVPEPSSNPGNPGVPVQIKGPDGTPLVMDLGQVINWQKFQSEERRADGRHDSLVGLTQTIRENIPDGIQAILKAASETKGTGAKAPETKQEQSHVFECADCQTQFSPPPGWAGQPIKCPGCGREYAKEELA